MALSRIRRYEVQATYSVVLSLVSLLPFLVGVVALMMRFDVPGRSFVYGEGSLFLPGFLAVVAVSFLISAAGALLGLNSAGQRRNHKNKWSWTGFLLGGFVATLTVIMGLAFMMMRFEMPLPGA